MNTSTTSHYWFIAILGREDKVEQKAPKTLLAAPQNIGLLLLGFILKSLKTCSAAVSAARSCATVGRRSRSPSPAGRAWPGRGRSCCGGRPGRMCSSVVPTAGLPSLSRARPDWTSFRRQSIFILFSLLLLYLIVKLWNKSMVCFCFIAMQIRFVS